MESVVERERITAPTPGKGYRFWKRSADVLLSALALAVLWPWFVLICGVILLDDPHGSPIYAQERCGKDGRLFRMYKFRSMVQDADRRRAELMDQNEADGPVFKIRQDPRITRVGHFIRKTCIDELPQIWNVLLGQMSLVGPRPPLPEEVQNYTQRHRQRLTVKPGLTCIWQVTPGKHSLSFEEWIDMDLEYIRSRSLGLDLKLILKTLGVMFSGEGQ